MFKNGSVYVNIIAINYNADIELKYRNLEDKVICRFNSSGSFRSVCLFYTFYSIFCKHTPAEN